MSLLYTLYKEWSLSYCIYSIYPKVLVKFVFIRFSGRVYNSDVLYSNMAITDLSVMYVYVIGFDYINIKGSNICAST